MALPRGFSGIGPSLAAVALAALWPITAYAISPVLLPAALILCACMVVIVTRPEYGLALALVLCSELGLQIPQPAGAKIALPSAPFELLVPLLVVGVLVYSGLVRPANRRRLPSPALAIVFVIAAGLLTSLHALEPTRSIHDVLLLVTGGALFAAVATVCRSRDELLVVVGGALAGLLVAAVHGIVQHYSGVFSTQGFIAGGEAVGRVQGSFGHPNEYAGFLGVLLPLGIIVGATRQLPGALRALGAFAAAAAVPALVFSYARGAMVTLLAGSLIWLGLLRPKAAGAALLTVIVAGAVFAPSVLTDRLSSGAAEQDVPLRTDLAKSSLEIYSSHPLLGVGPNNFGRAYAELPSSEPGSRRLLHNDQLLVPTASPSQYLNTLSEQGLVGLVALLVFLASALRVTYRASRARDPAAAGLGLGIGMGVFSLILYSILEVSLQEPAALPLLALLAVAASAEPVFAASPAEDPSRGRAAATSTAGPRLPAGIPAHPSRVPSAAPAAPR